MKSFVLLLVPSLALAQPAPEPDPVPTPAPEPVPAQPEVVVTPAPVVVAPAPTPAPPAPTIIPTAQESAQGNYKDGFLLRAGGDGYKLSVGGISQFDSRTFFGDDSNTLPDQFAFRTLRLDLKGTVFDHFDFRFMPDFAGSKIVVQDAYVDVRYSKVLKVRFGKFKVPFGLERLQNETSTTFAERGLPTQLAPNRDLGVQLFGEVAEGTLAYQVGLFNGIADNGNGDGDATDDKELAARVFVRPFATGIEELKNFGVGAAITFGDKTASLTQPDVPQWKTAGQATIFQYRTGTTLDDTVVADGRHTRVTGQGYYYVGPFGVLGEYVRSIQHVVLKGTHDRVSADAWQALVQYVITGDDATYNSVTPKHPFDPKTGDLGAFDVTARVGELRVTDGEVFQTYVDPTKYVRRAWSGGVGVDWFANRAFRVALNFDRTWFTLGAKSGDRASENVLLARVQLVF